MNSLVERSFGVVHLRLAHDLRRQSHTASAALLGRFPRLISLGLLLISAELQAQDTTRSASRTGVLISLGKGRFPANPGPSRGPSSAIRNLVGVGLEIRAATRYVGELDARYGFSSKLCSEWCPSNSLFVTASFSRMWGLRHSRAGFYLGPSLTFMQFDRSDVGIGVHSAIGVNRGSGPFLAVDYISPIASRPAIAGSVGVRVSR